MNDNSRDRYFRHIERGTVNVILIPANWPVDADGDLLGYGATRLETNDGEIDSLWFPVSALTDEITEAEARAIHPALFAYLDKINSGEI